MEFLVHSSHHHAQAFFSITLMHHMAKDTHIALANVKCTLTKERNKQQGDRKEYTTYN